MQEVLYFLIKNMTGAVVSSNWIAKIRVWHSKNVIQNPTCRKGQFENTSKAFSVYLLPDGAIPLPFPD